MQSIFRERSIGCLMEISGLVDLYERKDPSFLQRVMAWLSESEKAFAQLRHPFAAFPAAQRAQILAAREGLRDAGTENTRHQRKIAPIAAAQALSRMEEELRDQVSSLDEIFEDAKGKIAQLLVIASAVAPLSAPEGRERQIWLEEIWARLGEASEARALYLYLNASLAKVDRLYLLNEIVRQWFDE